MSTCVWKIKNKTTRRKTKEKQRNDISDILIREDTESMSLIYIFKH